MHQGNLNGQYYIKGSFGLRWESIAQLLVEVLAPYLLTSHLFLLHSIKHGVMRTFSVHEFSPWFDLVST